VSPALVLKVPSGRRSVDLKYDKQIWSGAIYKDAWLNLALHFLMSAREGILLQKSAQSGHRAPAESLPPDTIWKVGRRPPE
jgi:hypothetical protein